MIIQFSHNGQELNISKRSPKNGKAYKFDEFNKNKGIRYWNNLPKHKRKFIKSNGWYLENQGDSFNTIPKMGEFCFWGEWEAQSEFILTGNKYTSKPSFPNAIHYPIFLDEGKGMHNTDPFVFGEHFYYTNCKQHSYKFLMSLEEGSIIIYGSEKAKSHFIIDTVFVVGKSELIKDYKLYKENYPKTLRETTIDLHGGLGGDLKLYQGKMYDFNVQYSDQEPYIFSFVPCIPNCEKKGFERPVIDWQKFNLKKPGSGTVTQKINYKSNIDFWQDLVAELLKQGFSLAVKIDMPETGSMIDTPVYEIKDSNCNKKKGCSKSY